VNPLYKKHHSLSGCPLAKSWREGRLSVPARAILTAAVAGADQGAYGYSNDNESATAAAAAAAAAAAGGGGAGAGGRGDDGIGGGGGSGANIGGGGGGGWGGDIGGIGGGRGGGPSPVTWERTLLPALDMPANRGLPIKQCVLEAVRIAQALPAPHPDLVRDLKVRCAVSQRARACTSRAHRVCIFWGARNPRHARCSV
jgi:hypothetical protein